MWNLGCRAFGASQCRDLHSAAMNGINLKNSAGDTDLTLLELAAECGCSRIHLLRVFHATTALTPHHYVLRRCVERARQLLEQTDLSIPEGEYRRK